MRARLEGPAVDMLIESPAWGIAVAMSVGAALTDLRVRRIPNVLPVLGCLAGLFVNVSASGQPGLQASLAGFFVGAALLLPAYLLRFAGGGDLKLTAAVGCLLGPSLALAAFFIAAIFAGFWARGGGLGAWYRGEASLPFARYWEMLRFLLVTGQLTYYRPAVGEVAAMRVPFAPAMAIGTIVAPFLIS